MANPRDQHRPHLPRSPSQRDSFVCKAEDRTGRATESGPRKLASSVYRVSECRIESPFSLVSRETATSTPAIRPSNVSVHFPRFLSARGMADLWGRENGLARAIAVFTADRLPQPESRLSRLIRRLSRMFVRPTWSNGVTEAIISRFSRNSFFTSVSRTRSFRGCRGRTSRCSRIVRSPKIKGGFKSDSHRIRTE